MTLSDFQKDIRQGIPDALPPLGIPDDKVSHAPRRLIDGVLSPDEQKLAVRNALRYFPSDWHATLAPEFLEELRSTGRIYMHRFRPAYPMYARPLAEYPARSTQAAAIMLMIQNNLDPKVAKHPHELITYGGNGAVFQNWAQYRLVMKYLADMTDQQTLVVYSGHPLGLFPAHPDAPRVVVTNGMMIPNYSRKEDWNRFNALGVTQYGQMTAGSYMYIGPQGIVHGTTITLLNAGRKLGLGSDNLRGRVFVTSGLGGMSGAQALAAVITGCVGVIAEIDPEAVQQRIADGYIRADYVYSDVHALTRKMVDAKASNEAVALVYQGNVVDLWEHFVQYNIHIDLGSDQTSCHNIDDMGYCPQGYSFEEAKKLLISDKAGFMAAVGDTLRRHARAINHMSERGMYFWDYGNAFLKEAGDVGAAVFKSGRQPLLPGELSVEESPYRYPSYVEDIMGPLCFDYGFGPFRWVCCSGLQSDLDASDSIAASVLEGMLPDAPEEIRGQLMDNLLWIRSAHANIPVVGSMARILYADSEGRLRIAGALNEAIARGTIKGPIVLGRDHHDVSGTDSPFRETANIYDGSRYTADMAVQNVIGDAFRGATWVSLHNGGGVGWGQVVNGGFGLVIDGSPEAESRLKRMLLWDVNNGIARRAWARNPHAVSTIKRTMEAYPDMKVTLASVVEEDVLDALFEEDTIITA